MFGWRHSVDSRQVLQRVLSVVALTTAAFGCWYRHLRLTEQLTSKVKRDNFPEQVQFVESRVENDDMDSRADPTEQLDFDAQVAIERCLLGEGAATVRLVLRTGAHRFLPFPFSAEKQLVTIADKLEEIAELSSPHNIFWRYGRDHPMAALLTLPLFDLAASKFALIPVTLGYVSEPGELAIARFLVSGTDARKSRYYEFSSGILDAVQRDRLLFRLETIFMPVWDLPLTWGDEMDNVSLGSGNPHNAIPFGVSTGLSS
eukprot:TRINITY_DN17621_c0_g1_i1.p1 TRINITY_DN17621_c0_g1~~TRINITY_DN17621_c0_g1_i1.p1  ORF type:complete len:259 (-),score=30.08 TRINITY_DN17621_c0_g1_i1:20-796(-)